MPVVAGTLAVGGGAVAPVGAPAVADCVFSGALPAERAPALHLHSRTVINPNTTSASPVAIASPSVMIS